MSRVIVAGHLCLDIIPEVLTSTPIEPGQLVDTGPSILSTGGAVSNVGLALRKLGMDVALVAKIGEDAFGDAIARLVRGFGDGLDAHLSRTSTAQTSYSIVISQPGRDRTFLHHPGCNHYFGSEDVDFDALPQSEWFHFGYPPLMRRMFSDGGVELADIFARAKRAGLTTSLDMSLPDSAGESGRAPWPQILAKVLPHVDFFMPSEEEASLMTGGADPAQKALEWGAKNVVLKCGADGLRWTDGTSELHQPVFPVEIVGTTGSGDATIAGFIYGMAHGYSIAESLRIGCAVGASSCEAADSLSGILDWATIRDRFVIPRL